MRDLCGISMSMGDSMVHVMVVITRAGKVWSLESYFGPAGF